MSTSTPQQPATSVCLTLWDALLVICIRVQARQMKRTLDRDLGRSEEART